MCLLTGVLLFNFIYTRYLLVECNEGKETKEGAMYLNVMRRFSHALMKVSAMFHIFILSVCLQLKYSPIVLSKTFNNKIEHPPNYPQLDFLHLECLADNSLLNEKRL